MNDGNGYDAIGNDVIGYAATGDLGATMASTEAEAEAEADGSTCDDIGASPGLPYAIAAPVATSVGRSLRSSLLR